MYTDLLPTSNFPIQVLSLIQTWADAFRNQPDLQGAYLVYTELKSKGIEFPMTDLDAMAPIHTPQRTVSNPPPVGPQALSTVGGGAVGMAHTLPANNRHPVQAARLQGPIKLNIEQMAKLRSELNVVQANMKIFDEMLQELTPGKEHDDDWELLRDLNATCEAMKKRIVDLIEKVANEEVTNELLRINDEMNLLFVRYERFVKKKSNAAPGGVSRERVDGKVEKRSNEAQSLIDLDDNLGAGAAGGNMMAMSSRLDNVALDPKREPAGNDDFDMFAQSRSAPGEAGGGRSRDNSQTDYSNASTEPSQANLGLLAQSRTQRDMSVPDLLQDDRTEFDEMERWLGDQSTQKPPETAVVANSDFERFLAERAMAAERLPSNPDTPEKKPDPFGL